MDATRVPPGSGRTGGAGGASTTAADADSQSVPKSRVPPRSRIDQGLELSSMPWRQPNAPRSPLSTDTINPLYESSGSRTSTHNSVALSEGGMGGAVSRTGDADVQASPKSDVLPHREMGQRDELSFGPWRQPHEQGLQDFTVDMNYLYGSAVPSASTSPYHSIVPDEAGGVEGRAEGSVEGGAEDVAPPPAEHWAVIPHITVGDSASRQNLLGRVFNHTQQHATTVFVGMRSRTHEPTTLSRLAAVLAKDTQPEARVGRQLNRAFEAVASTVIPGYATTPTWAQDKIRSLRAEACISGSATSVKSAALLQTLKAEDPVSSFWAALPIPGEGSLFGEQGEAFLGALDAKSDAHGPRVPLAVSGAFLMATRDEPELKAQLSLELFARLDNKALIASLSHVSTDTNVENDAQLRLIRATLEKCANSNQFEKMVGVLCPGIDRNCLPTLKRLLQAGEAVRKMRHDDVSATEASLAMRVQNTARQQLSLADPNLLNRKQTVDNFFWDNGFRVDGPGSELQQAKQHFFKTLAVLGNGPDSAGPFKAACSNGVAGADLKLLEQNEIAKLGQVIADNSFDAAISAVDDKLAQIIESERARRPPDTAAVDNVVRAMANSIALQGWAPANKQLLTTVDQLQGSAAVAADDATLAEAKRMCRQYVAGANIGGNPGPLDIEDVALTPPQESLCAQMELRVKAALGNVHLGFNQLQTLAQECGAPNPLFDRAVATIKAKTAMPIQPTSEAVGQMMANFLNSVYFGNHLKLSQVVNLGVSTRGLAINEPSYSASEGEATPTPKIARVEVTRERQMELVVRAGAATHGGELFLGHDKKTRVTAAGGGRSGHEWDLGKVFKSRLAAGGDVNPLIRVGSNYEGLMFRVERAVLSEVTDGANPEFRQNDDAVREVMAEFTQTLFTKAANASNEATREALLEECIERFGGRGLSMSLVTQKTSSNSSEVYGVVSGSASAGVRAIAGRGSADVSTAYENTWRTRTAENDSTGTYRVNNFRTGFSGRVRVSSGVTANLGSTGFGAPATPIVKGTMTFCESGASVRVRTAIKDGNIVPEKTFSDTESPDPALFKELVLSNRQKWVDLFAYEHRHLGEADAQQIGNKKVNEFFAKIEGIREGHHVYYARERMHPDVAQRIDELAGVVSMLPEDMSAVREEFLREQQRLAKDDRSWAPASLIAYEKIVKQDGLGGAFMGVSGGVASAAEGEREIIFDTPGWLVLRQRERADPPRHLDE